MLAGFAVAVSSSWIPSGRAERIEFVGELASRLLTLELFGLVGLDVLDGGPLGDLASAVGVDDVVGVEVAERGLLEIVDRNVFEHVAVEVLADDLDDLVAEVASRSCHRLRQSFA